MSEESSVAEFSVPSEENITKAVKEYAPIVRNYVEEPDNLADNEELVSKYSAQTMNFYNRFIGTAERKDLERYLKDADAKYRMAANVADQYSDTSTQKQNTLSHVASEQFYNSIKLIHSGLTSIIFGDGEVNPARYEPIKGCNDYTAPEGKRITEEQTAYYEGIYDIEDWNQKLKESMLWMCKNAQELISVQWMYRTKSQIERVPGYYTADGEPVEWVIGQEAPEEMYDVNGDMIVSVFSQDDPMPKSYAFVRKTRVVQNHPIFLRIPLKRCLFDLGITGDSFNDCMQKQSCVITWDDVTFDELIAGEKDGLYKNVSKITKAHLFDGSDEEGGNIDKDQQDNADTDTENTKNGLYRRYHVYQMAPIDYDKNEWDAKQIPSITESVFVGKMEGGNSSGTDDETCKSTVCLMLRKLPYHHERFPLKLINCLKDDKEGAIKMGYYNLIECNIEEQITTMNQHIDNKTLKIKTPFVGERGNVLSRDLIFKNGNQVLWVKAGTGGTALTQLKIDDMTASTIPTMEMLKKAADETLDTTDVIRGAFAGSRTTGTEVLSVREQALQPAIEHAKAIASQYFGYILPEVADLSRQYADPSNPLQLDDNDVDISIANPASLYGDYKVKIVGVDKFKADLSAKEALIQFVQVGGYDKAVEFMQESGALHFWRTVGSALKIPDVLTIFPAAKRMVEAENQAWNDVYVIETDPERAMNDAELLPKQDERHDIHLSILTSQKKRYKTVAQAQDRLNPQVIAAFDLYEQMHTDFAAAEQTQVQSDQQPQGIGSPSTMSGENMGDQLAGEQGQLAPRAI